jgi:hypothetical protein
MKKKNIQLLALFFIATICTSCSVDLFNKVDGNRNVLVKERKPQAHFSEIKVSNGIDLFIRQGTANAITIEADKNLHAIIITEVNAGVLKIYTEKNIWKAKSKKVYVTIENITLLKATSGSDVYSENLIKTKELSVISSSGANVNIEVSVQNLITKASSGSDLRIYGSSIQHASNASSGSSINASNLKSENVTAKATSGADINIYASLKIEAKATSGASIDFKGSPNSIQKTTNSGGNISKK